MTSAPNSGTASSNQEGSNPLSIDVRSLDARYKPISAFREWSELSIDNAIWQRQTQAFETRRATMSQEDIDRALAIAMRAAAAETGAIEGLYETNRGLTLTIAVQAATWETLMRSHDERMPDFFKAQLRAYDLASEIARSREPITEVWIRQLHEVLCEPQAEYDALTAQGWIKSPLPKGEYKQQPNHVLQADGSAHAYAPVDMTRPEMHRLVEELNSSKFESAHSVLQTAYAHYCLVAIHPFVDGNGRVARAVASVFLRRDSHIPLLIWSDQRAHYFNALEAADKGNRKAIVDFVFDRAIDTLTLVREELGPRPEDYLAALGNLHQSYGGLSFRELDDKAREFATRAIEIVNTVISELTFPLGTTAGASTMVGGSEASHSATYRDPIGGPILVQVDLQSPAPAQARVQVACKILIAKDEKARYAFQLERRDKPGPPLEIRLQDVIPIPSEAVSAQIRGWMRSMLADGLADLVTQAEAARRSQDL